MYQICKVKNIDTVAGTYVGTLLNPNDEYTIEDQERLRWANDDTVIAAITSDKLQVGSSSEYISGYSDQIDWLKNKRVSVEELNPKGTLQLPEMAIHKVEGNSYAYVSHDFCDPCSWFGDSVRVTGETLSLDSGLTYSSANINWIDLAHGRKYQEDLISAPYLPKVYDNGVELVEDTDYTIDYSAGKVTLSSSPVGTITADYSYENGSTFYLYPADLATGIVRFIEHTELQCSKSVIINDSIVFEIWVYNPADLPNKILYETIEYKSAKDYINGANLGQGNIPAFGGSARGVTQDTLVFPFNYASMTPISAETGSEVRVRLKNDQAFTGTDAFGTVTFYILEEV